MYITKFYCKDKKSVFAISKTPPEDLFFSIRAEVKSLTSRNVTAWLVSKGIVVKQIVQINTQFRRKSSADVLQIEHQKQIDNYANRIIRFHEAGDE